MGMECANENLFVLRSYDLLSFNSKERILILFLSSPSSQTCLQKYVRQKQGNTMFWSWLVETTWINVTAHKIEQFLGGLCFSLPKWFFLQEVAWRFILISRLWLWSLCSVTSQVTWPFFYCSKSASVKWNKISSLVITC